jgi:hypothetical protein
MTHDVLLRHWCSATGKVLNRYTCNNSFIIQFGVNVLKRYLLRTSKRGKVFYLLYYGKITDTSKFVSYWNPKPRLKVIESSDLSKEQ